MSDKLKYIIKQVALTDIKSDNGNWHIDDISNNINHLASIVEAFRDYAALRGDEDLSQLLCEIHYDLY